MFFHPELEGQKTPDQAYVRETIRRQQDLYVLLRHNTAQTYMRQRMKSDKKVLQARPYSVRQNVWLCQILIPSKKTKKSLKKR